MNPLTNMKNVIKLSENELKGNSKTSWHDMYRDSAWIFVGGLPYDLTEGDLLCVFSQYGEIVNVNLVRDKISGKSKGFCFICFEDQRSTILTVDNLNGIKILGRSLRVDHVAEYKVPKDNDKIDEETRQLRMEGCAPKLQIPEELIKEEKLKSNPNNPDSNIKIEESAKVKKEKKSKKEKKLKKDKKTKKKRKHKKNKSNSESEDSTSNNERKSRKHRKKSHKKRYSSESDSNNSSSERHSKRDKRRD